MRMLNKIICSRSKGYQLAHFTFKMCTSNIPPLSVSYTVFDLCTWLGRVLGVVKHQHIRGGGLGGDDAGVLGHVAGTVHLSFMADLDFYLDLATY